MTAFNYTLHVEADTDDHAAGRVWLIASSAKPELEFSHPIYTSFTAEELHDVLTAIPWVSTQEDSLALSNDVWHQHLAEVVQKMLTYFARPEEPTEELLRVREAVTNTFAARGAKVEIPLAAFAWLDIMVREDIAQEAEQAAEIWGVEEVTISCLAHRAARIEEMLTAHSGSTMRLVGRLAASRPTRASQSQAKLG